MDSETYWRNRYKIEVALQDHLYETAATYIQTTWETASQNIEDNITKYYKMVDSASNPYSIMRTILNKTELNKLKKRVTTQLNQTNPTPKQYAQKILQLRKTTLQQAMNIENTMHLYNAATNTDTKLDTLLTQVFNLADIFNKHSANMLGIKFHQPSSSQIKALKQQAWLGENYSTRIWDNTTKLAQTLEYDLPHLFVMGLPQQEVAALIQRIHNVGYSQAMRLVVTEGRKVNTDADNLLYTQLGTKQYRYLAKMDSRTSDICKSLNGEKFFVKDMEVGVNAPPMHPNCRSTTMPVIDMNGASDKSILEAELETVKTYGAYKLNGKTRSVETITKELKNL